MNTPNELDRRLVAFYATEPHSKAPDRVLVNALTTIESTPQRRVLALAPWRFHLMNVSPKLAGASVAVIALATLAVVGLQPNNSSAGASGPPPATSTPRAVVPSSMPSPSAAPSPTSVAAIRFPDRGLVGTTGALAPGRYSVPVRGSDVRLELTVAETGWFGYSTRLSTGFGANPDMVSFGTVTNVYADACLNSSLPHPAIGPTVDDLVAALDAQKHTVMEQSSHPFVGGHSSTRFVMRLAEGVPASCTNPRLWWSEGQIPGHGGFEEQVGLSSTAASAGKDDLFWVVDVDGTRVVIMAHYDQTKASRSASIQAMLDSIQFVRD